ncbi:MAG TPA: anti-sigma regulatory factor [Anaerolineae bacterium]|nr:anti-sigma regulatory factor [Anaerolineae bacterium]
MIETVQVKVAAEAHVYVAAYQVKALARQMGFNEADQTRLETVTSELARNIVLYAGEGAIEVEVVTKGKRRGLKIQALDYGPGIADIEQAMKDGYTTSGGLGSGLGGAKRMMDEFHIESAPGRGTRVTAIKWLNMEHETQNTKHGER